MATIDLDKIRVRIEDLHNRRIAEAEAEYRRDLQSLERMQAIAEGVATKVAFSPLAESAKLSAAITLSDRTLTVPRLGSPDSPSGSKAVVDFDPVKTGDLRDERAIERPRLRKPLKFEGERGAKNTAAIGREAVRALAGEFTKRHIRDYAEKYYAASTLTSDDLSSILNKMRKRGEVTMIRKSLGHQPAVYRRGPALAVLTRSNGVESKGDNDEQT